MQWDKRSRIFQLISKKCPKSRDDMELKTNNPSADHKYGVQWDKRSRIFELISKKYGMQWDKRSRIFQLILKKCPKSRDDAEVKKKDPTAHHKYGMQWDKRSKFFQLIFEKNALSPEMIWN